MNKIQKFVIISLIVMVFCIPASSFSDTISYDTDQIIPMIKFENIISTIEDTNSIYDSFFNVYDSNNELVYSTCNPDGLITLNQPVLSYSDISVDELPYFEITYIKSWWAESLLKYFPVPDESIRLDTYSMFVAVKNVGGDLPITELIKLNFTVEIDSYPYDIPTDTTLSTNYFPHNFSWVYGLRRGYQDPQWFKPNTSLVTANINCTIGDFTQNEINASAPCTYDMRISGDVTSIDIQGDIIPVQSTIFCSLADINFLTITITNNTGAYEISVHPLDQPTIFTLQALKEGYENQIEFSEPIYMENDTTVVNLHLNRLNERPFTPEIIGELNGTSGDSYEYTFSSSDPNDDYLYYYIDWGDDETEEWIGPYASGEDVIKSHIWDEEGTYTILCKTKDVLGAESDWGILKVTMPINKSYNFPFLQKLFEIFPNAFLILRQLFGLWAFHTNSI